MQCLLFSHGNKDYANAHECYIALRCQSCSFNFSIPALIHFASFDVLTVIMKVIDCPEVTLFGDRQSTDISLKLRRILRTGVASHPKDDNLLSLCSHSIIC
jgi:hypothetical protein